MQHGALKQHRQKEFISVGTPAHKVHNAFSHNIMYTLWYVSLAQQLETISSLKTAGENQIAGENTSLTYH